METLKEKTAKGLFWGALNGGTMQLLNVIFGIVLARILSPADYAIVGVLAIFSTIADNLQSSGFEKALVNLKHPTYNDYNSVFWFNITASSLIYVVLFLAAPLIADFYHEPRLTSLSRLVFLSFVIASFGISHHAYMIKNLMNRELTICSITALVCSGTVGIVLAFCGFSFWSLAWQQIVYISVLNVCRYFFTPNFHSFHIDFSPVKQMFGFSVKLLVTNIINTINNNILTSVFAKFYPMNKVGYFSQAYKWNLMAGNFIYNTFGQVAQPVLVSSLDDEAREQRIFRKMMRFISLVSFPTLLGLGLISHEFIVFLLGDKWVESAILLRILCVGGAFLPLHVLYQNLVISHERSDIYMWVNIGVVFTVLAMILGFHTLGITAMVIAYSVLQVVLLIVWHMVSGKLIGLTISNVIMDTVPFLVVAFMVMVAVYFTTSFITNNLLLLCVRIPLAAFLYYAVLRLLHVQILKECENFIKSKIKK